MGHVLFHRFSCPVLSATPAGSSSGVAHERSPIEEFGDRPFSTREALARGVSAKRLASPLLGRPYHGTRIEGPTAELHDIVARCREYAPRLAPGQFFSHATALHLWGAPVPIGEQSRLHVSAYRPAREPRTKGIVGHRLQVREAAFQLLDGLPVEHPVRAWRQASATWGRGALVAAGDFLIARARPLASVDELAHELAVMHGPARALPILRQLRSGAESPRESLLRLFLYDAGLPEAELNWDLRDERGRFVARLDLAYPWCRVGVEYDGRHHAADAAQFARDADRWESIRACGWTLVRVLDHHMRDRGAAAVAMVRRALP